MVPIALAEERQTLWQSFPRSTGTSVGGSVHSNGTVLTTQTMQTARTILHSNNSNIDGKTSTIQESVEDTNDIEAHDVVANTTRMTSK